VKLEGPPHQVNTAAVSGQTTRLTDGVLMDAVKSGDAAAFEALFERYYPQVYAVTMRVVGSPEDAEELTLDVFMKLYERPLERVEDGALGGWLYRTALNSAFNSLRSRKRRLGWLQRAALLYRRDQQAADDPAVVVERDSDAREVRVALSRLPEKQRNVLVLRSHGFQYREIAQAVGISPTSVGTTLARAERALRHQLENEVGPR
jgi:RNA polymerase sigma factor (sigma-70 family)